MRKIRDLLLLLSIPLFGTSQSWWGALPDLSWPFVLLLLAAGAFIVDRIDKFPLMLSFLGASFLNMQPLTAPVWIGGLAWLLVADRARPYRALGVTFLPAAPRPQPSRARVLSTASPRNHHPARMPLTRARR